MIPTLLNDIGVSIQFSVLSFHLFHYVVCNQTLTADLSEGFVVTLIFTPEK